MRKLLKILGFFLLLLIVALFICLRPVDSEPYFESDFYQTTIRQLDSLQDKVQLSEGSLQVGLAKVNITPIGPTAGDLHMQEVPMAGYGDREGKPAQGVHDSLYVKAVALQAAQTRLVILAADMLIIPPNISEQVRAAVEQRSGLAADQLFFSATHTHSSVGGWSSHLVGEAFAGEPAPELVNWLAERFIVAVEKALADLQPGVIGFGSFEAPELVKNRLIGERGKELPTFSFLRAEQAQGKKALIGIFAAHATTLGGNNWQFSADYPGYFYHRLEAAGIDLPVFCAGSVGSHGPESQGKDFEKSQYLGETLADSVLKYSRMIVMTDTITLTAFQVKMELPSFQVRLTDGLRLAPFLSEKLFPPVGAVFVQSARIGHFIWTTTPADFSGESAINHQNNLYHKGFASAITSFNGAYVGYVLPAKYYHYNEYESRVMSWFGPNMGPYMDEIIYRMTESLTAL